MKSLLLLPLLLPLLGIQSSALAGGCETRQGALICFSKGVYYVEFPDGSRMSGQCGNKARWSSKIPFVLANEIHVAACGAPLVLD